MRLVALVVAGVLVAMAAAAAGEWPQVGGGDGPLCAPVVHGGKVVVHGGQGMLACIDATRPDVLARALPFADDPGGGHVRALPALANGTLYLRNDRTLIALDVGP